MLIEQVSNNAAQRPGNDWCSDATDGMELPVLSMVISCDLLFRLPEVGFLSSPFFVYRPNAGFCLLIMVIMKMLEIGCTGIFNV